MHSHICHIHLRTTISLFSHSNTDKQTHTLTHPHIHTKRYNLFPYLRTCRFCPHCPDTHTHTHSHPHTTTLKPTPPPQTPEHTTLFRSHTKRYNLFPYLRTCRFCPHCPDTHTHTHSHTHTHTLKLTHTHT